MSTVLQKKWVFLIGIAILVIGLMLVAYRFLVPPEYADASSLTLQPNQTPVAFTVEAWSGDILTFSIEIPSYFDFYVMTDADFNDMRNDQLFTYIYRRDSLSSEYTYTFTAPENNRYAFVLREFYAGTDVTLHFSISRIASYRTILLYVGIALSIVGVVFTSLSLYASRHAKKAGK